jgi:arsenate reductase
MSNESVHLYGIRNCDTMKKALSWVSEHDIDYVFHDYKKEGVERSKLVEWCKAVGWKSLLNTKGTTWKKLTPEQQAVTAQGQAVVLMMENPSLIRRPVVEVQGQLLIGFDATLFESFMR